MKQTLIGENVRECLYMQLGFRYDIETNPYVLRFDGARCYAKVLDSPHFGNKITLLNSCRIEDKIHHSSELTE
jgi:hypothetical protein